MAWTNEGRNESVGCHKKIPKRVKEIKKPKFEKEEDLQKWIESKIDEADEDEDEGLASSRSVEKNVSAANTERDSKDKLDSARDAAGQDEGNDDVAQIEAEDEQDGYFSSGDVDGEDDLGNDDSPIHGYTHHDDAEEGISDNDEEEEG